MESVWIQWLVILATNVGAGYIGYVLGQWRMKQMVDTLKKADKLKKELGV